MIRIRIKILYRLLCLILLERKPYLYRDSNLESIIFYAIFLLSIEPWAVPPVTVRVPSQRSRTPSVALVTSVANDKGDNEMILGAVHRYPGIFLIAEENPFPPNGPEHCSQFHRDRQALKMMRMASKSFC